MPSFRQEGFAFFRQNLDPSDFFPKVPTKNKPFGFHFSKVADNKLRIRIPAILGGGGGGEGRGAADKKWNVPIQSAYKEK